jgi:hypothetical protein
VSRYARPVVPNDYKIVAGETEIMSSEGPVGKVTGY